MKYVLQELLQVRHFREDNAATAVTVQKLRVEEATFEVERRRRELVEFIQRRVQREEQLYAQIIDQQVQIKDIEDLKLRIQMLRGRELAFEENIRTAEKELSKAEEGLLEAKQAHKRAVKDRQKLEEHKSLWQVEVAKELEYGMEKELEDFRSRHAEEEDDDATEFA